MATKKKQDIEDTAFEVSSDNIFADIGIDKTGVKNRRNRSQA